MTGLALYLATRARVDGSFAPGGADAIQRRRSDTIRALLLSSDMRFNSSAIAPENQVLSPPRNGLGWGLLGVAAFSLTVPLTRITVQDGAMSAMFVGVGRAVVAALLAVVVLAVTRQRRPRGMQWLRLTVVAGGVVIGFPVLTAYALTTTSAAHSAVVIAMLPAATAVAAVVRGRERPPRSFWVTAGVAATAAVGFAALRSGGLGGLHLADLLLLGAVVAAAIGYAEGGLLARELGSWQTISWALVLAAPVTTATTVLTIAEHRPTGTAGTWAAFAYLAVVSMFLGFFAWYRGLAIGPMTRVSQIQLTQPVLTICWAALLLGEQPTTSMLIGGTIVILCAATAVRNRSAARRPDQREACARVDPFMAHDESRIGEFLGDAVEPELRGNLRA